MQTVVIAFMINVSTFHVCFKRKENKFGKVSMPSEAPERREEGRKTKTNNFHEEEIKRKINFGSVNFMFM